jgi:hypothetical protein
MGKITKFVVVNFIIPSVLGIVMANLGVIGCVFWNKIFVQAPCWLINFLVFSLLIAIFLDILVYFVWPKFVKKPKKSELLNLEFSDVSQSDNLGKIYLSVVNNGTKKIVDLEARLEEIQQHFLVKDELLQSFWKILPDKQKNILNKSEAKPGIPLSAIMVSFSSDYSEVFFEGMSKNITVERESIFRVKIIYSGKLDGETEFGNKTFDIDLYCNPSKKLFCLATLASGITRLDGVQITNQLLIDKYKDFRLNK